MAYQTVLNVTLTDALGAAGKEMMEVFTNTGGVGKGFSIFVTFISTTVPALFVRRFGRTTLTETTHVGSGAVGKTDKVTAVIDALGIVA